MVWIFARLTVEGVEPEQALICFEQWLNQVIPVQIQPIFLALTLLSIDVRQ